MFINMKLDIWSIFIIVVIFQGMFVISTFLLSKEKRERMSNRYLFLIILLFIWYLSEFLSIRQVYKVH